MPASAAPCCLPSEGPGLVVTLDDSPMWKNMVDSSGSTSNINDYVTIGRTSRPW